MPIYNLTIPENLHGQRVDKAISLLCDNVSRSQIQKAIKNHKLTLNNEIVSNLSMRIKVNDQINLLLEEEEQQTGIIPANIPLDIVYEDDDLIILNKSSSMTVHLGAGNYKETLVNALLYHTDQLSTEGGEIRPGIVHRLDKNTSGLMVIAKNNSAHRSLASQLESRTLKRKYKALVWGIIRPQEGSINQQIARSKLDRKRMTTVKSGGKVALTHYKTLEIFKSGLFSLLECQLDTGRTHQIRVHLSHIGHSILGDQTYGNNKRKITNCSDALKTKLTEFKHQALHSFYIGFIHPTSGNFIDFEKELPLDYTEIITFLRTS